MEFVKAHAASWAIEILILGIVGFITIGEVRETNAQTRAMLTSISEFAAQYQGQAGEAVGNVLHEVATIEVEGSVDAKDLGEAAKNAVTGYFSKDEDTEED